MARLFMRLPLLGLVSILLGGCPSQIIPGPVAQLDRYEKAEQAGRPADIVSDPLNSDCTGGAAQSAACSKLHAIRGRACLQVARQAAAPNAACPGSAARDTLACAVENYGAVLNDSSFSADMRNDFRDNHARASYCLANLSGGADRQRLGQQAIDDLGRLPADPRRDQLAASAMLMLADAGTGQARCDQYRQAAAMASRGLAAKPDAELTGGLQWALTTARSRAARASCGRI